MRDNTVKFDGSLFTMNRWNYNYGLYVYLFRHNDIQITGNNIDMKNGYYGYVSYAYSQDVANFKKWEYNNYNVQSFDIQAWYNNLGFSQDFAGWLNSDFGKNETAHRPMYVDESKLDLRINVFELQNKVPLYTSNNSILSSIF
jgi:hypothetical protein